MHSYIIHSLKNLSGIFRSQSILLMIFILYLFLTVQSLLTSFKQNKMSFDKLLIPRKRPFLPLQPPSVLSVIAKSSRSLHVHSKLRILQFNILADGLSGLRNDLGAFSRVKREDIIWEKRKHRVLEEIVQYDPDVITLQECDHYYDFFLPKLSSIGYYGLYSPKPASACLEVSQNADGCCIFVKTRKLKVKSAETITYALTRAEVSDEGQLISEDDKLPRVQNQVALVTVCEMIANDYSSKAPPSPPFVIATTHLKALKTSVGEKYRYIEARQLLEAINRVVSNVESRGVTCPVILTGDLNACPNELSTGYPSLAYKLVKSNKLNFRSVLNDDIPKNYDGVLGKLNRSSNLGPWTTWKARLKKGKEQIAKHCIDYILYTPLDRENNHSNVERRIGISALSVLDLFGDHELDPHFLPNSVYPSDHIAIAADLQIVELI